MREALHSEGGIAGISESREDQPLMNFRCGPENKGIEWDWRVSLPKRHGRKGEEVMTYHTSDTLLATFHLTVR